MMPRAPAFTRRALLLLPRGARSTHSLNLLKARVQADGHVSVWERAQVRMAQARHDRLVYRYTHN